MIGVATAPKATGAVLATMTDTAARMRENPMVRSMTPVMARGAPNPANASNMPPKQKAIRIACTRGSSESRSMRARKSWKRPERTVIS